MINTLGIFTGVTLSLLTNVQSPSETLTVSNTPEATQTAQISDYSPEHQVLSTYGADVPQIRLNTPNSGLEKEKLFPEKPQTKKTNKYLPLMLSTHPLNKDLLFDLINAHRTALNLPSFQKDETLCEIAESRLPELQEEILGDTPMHEGMRTRDFDFWVTENLIHVPNEERALEWWLNSPIHKKAVESTTYTHSCSDCIGNSCTQLFTSFQPKIK